MISTGSRAALLSTVTAAAFLLPHLADAQSADQRISAIEQQIKALNDELARVKRELAARDAAVRSAQADAARARHDAQQAQLQVSRQPAQSVALTQAPPAAGGPSPGTNLAQGVTIASGQPGSAGPQASSGLGKGSFRVGGVTVTLGGFVEAASVYRSRNMTTDLATPWNSIPFNNTQASHESELRFSSRQSRFSLLASGDIDNGQRLQGYAEIDLQGAAPTANSNESNSYNPRLRVFYGTYDNTELGVHALAGQAWSLATMYRSGLTPRQEDVPLTIDAQYVPGFTWTRQPQFRVTKDLFGGMAAIGLSIESPQTTYTVGANGTGAAATVNYNNTGVSNLNTTTTYSDEVAPDLILKAAADPGFGHYEVYGIARFPNDRASTLGAGHDNTKLAGGVGGGTILPIVPKRLDFEARALAGYGIGRYGSAQLPDATISPSGQPVPLPEVQALVGLVGHPIPPVDVYGYAGTEQIGRKAWTIAGKGYGYGSPLYSNAGCNIELSAATCTGNTSGIAQGTIGGWWRFFQGNYGTAEIGAQYSYTRRSIFKGLAPAGSNGNAGTDLNEVLVSLRYLPFQ
jgi:hypothetical protein